MATLVLDARAHLGVGRDVAPLGLMPMAFFFPSVIFVHFLLADIGLPDPWFRLRAHSYLV